MKILTFLLFSAPLVGHINLEENIEDFVLETRQITIPLYPDAFNPSIVRWREGYLLAFRFYDPESASTNHIGLQMLDKDFQSHGPAQILDIRFPDPLAASFRQDPRLIVVEKQLFAIYNNLLEGSSIRRMVIAKVYFNGQSFYALHPETILFFADENPKRSEKNWVPFAYENQLLLARSINPHWIFEPTINFMAREVTSSHSSINWPWGELRGGTPALIVDDQYLAFFHSSTYMRTIHSRGQLIEHYFMGAYTFSSHPPFELISISPQPIVGENFYFGQEYRTWKPIHVVFPGGYVFDEHFIWIVYGRQDHEIWMVKLDKKKLMDSLIPVVHQ